MQMRGQAVMTLDALTIVAVANKAVTIACVAQWHQKVASTLSLPLEGSGPVVCIL